MSAQLTSCNTVALQPPELQYLVGLDREGHWLAVETHGLAGGIFRSRKDALKFAIMETRRREGAVRAAAGELRLPV